MPASYERRFGEKFLKFDTVNRLLTTASLAMAELYIVLAVLYRPGGVKLELFETQESDVTPVHDFLIPLPKLESKGVRVVLGGG